MTTAMDRSPRKRSRTAGIRRVETTRGTRYEARWRERDGKERSKTFPNEEAAKAHLTGVRQSQRDGSYVSPDRTRTPFREIAEDWLTLRAGDPHVRPKTLEGYRREFRLHILPVFGDMPIGSIDSRAVERWLNDLRRSNGHSRRKQPIKAGTVLKIYIRMRAVFAYARRHNYIVANPCDAVDPPRHQEARRPDAPGEQFGRRLCEDEVQAISDELVKAEQPVYALLVRFLACTGLRASEMVGLRVGDVDIPSTVVHVRRTVKSMPWRVEETKNRLQRVAPILDEDVLADLTSYLAEHPYRHDPDAPFWPGRTKGGRLVYSPHTAPHYLDAVAFFRHHFRPAVRRAGLPAEPGSGIRLHDLRHTAISHWVDGGERTEDACDWAGHASIAFTQKVYVHRKQQTDYSASIARRRAAKEPRQTG